MAETLLEFQTPVTAPDGTAYAARACGAPMGDGMWQAWIEFEPLDGGPPLRSMRETTQPNRADTIYWATGLTPVYLEGSLRRTLEGPVRVTVSHPRPPAFAEPAPAVTAVDREAEVHSVLNPFSVYEKGEGLLRRQLNALSAWHLVNIILEYELSDEPVERLNTLPAAALIEIIVAGVRRENVAR